MAKSKNRCDGMRKDGTCGNGYNAENHNRPCRGKSCPHWFQYGRETGGHASAVVPPSRMSPSPVAKPVAAANWRDRVSDQYRVVCEKTGEFFREVAKFGAILNEVEAFLGDGRGRGNDGEGLQGWMAENCPEINYKTAMGYKGMAAKMATMIGGGTQALACLQGRTEVVNPATGETVEVDGKFIEKRDALFETVDSRRKLEQLWFDFCGKKPTGRPKGTHADLSRKPDSNDALAAARAVWSAVIVPADRTQPALASAAKLLNLKDVEDAKIVLQSLMDLLNARERELKPGGGAFKPVKF